MATELLLGFRNLKDVVNERVMEVGLETIDTAISQALEVYNTMTQQMLDLFTTTTTKHKIRYKTLATANLQPMDELGRPFKVHGASFYDLGFPLRQAGIAFGWDRQTLAKATVQEANDRLRQMQDADKRWLRGQMLSGLFYNASYSFSDPEYGALTVLPLANGDSQEYLLKPGFESAATANHYRTTTAIDNTNAPFATIYNDLTSYPENDGDGKVICFIPSSMKASVKALANFIEEEDPDIRQGANTAILTGSLGVSVPGEVIGKVDECWIVVWDVIPTDYILSIITSGPRPLVIREHPEAELRGFQAIAERADHPYVTRYFDRQAGFSPWNRLGAIIYKVTGGSYTVPTNYGIRAD